VRVLLAMVCLVAELVVTFYLALEAWLLTGWMVSDSTAADWNTGDWYRTGLARFAVAVVIAAAFGLVVYLVNGYTMRGANRHWRPLRIVVAASLTAVIALAAAVGTFDFVTTKPFM
jgi:hypothetical protein